MSNRRSGMAALLSTSLLTLLASSPAVLALPQITAEEAVVVPIAVGANGANGVNGAPERNELALGFHGNASVGSLLTVNVSGPPHERVLLVIGSSRASLLGLEQPVPAGTVDLTEVSAPGFRTLAYRVLELGEGGLARTSIAGWRTGGTVYFQANPLPPASAGPSPIHGVTSAPPGSSNATQSFTWTVTFQRIGNVPAFDPNITGFTVIGNGGPGTMIEFQGSNLIASNQDEHDVWVDHATAYFRVMSASPTQIVAEIADVEASGSSPLIVTLGEGTQVPVPPLAGLTFDPLWIFESVDSGAGSKVGPSGFSLTTSSKLTVQAPPAPAGPTAKWKKIGDYMVLDLADLGPAKLAHDVKFFTQVAFQYNTPSFQRRFVVLRTDDSGTMIACQEAAASAGIIKTYLDIAVLLGPPLRAKIVVEAVGSLIRIKVVSKLPPNTLQYKLRTGRGFFRLDSSAPCVSN